MIDPATGYIGDDSGGDQVSLFNAVGP